MSFMINMKGFALFEILITWGLVSGILVVLASMQMLSAAYSLDGLRKTHYVLNLASYGECLYQLRQDISESVVVRTLAECADAIQYLHASVEETSLDIEAQRQGNSVYIEYHWTDSHQYQQKVSVAIAL